VVILKDDVIAGYRIAPTGFDFLRTAAAVYGAVQAEAGVQERDVERIVATGYGRKSIDFAHEAVSEITAHATGVYALFPDVTGIIDVGGQDSKVIAVDGGRVMDFLMNDKCAAGTGKFLEHTASALEISVEALGALALSSRNPASISSTCTVFAESEVISLRARGITKEDIAAGLVESIVQRVSAMAKQLNLQDHIAFVGGVAKNGGIKAALERELGFAFIVPSEPQITGALGGSICGKEHVWQQHDLTRGADKHSI
jgi:predicted CoA-substrate-specific enzyme activase